MHKAWITAEKMHSEPQTLNLKPQPLILTIKSGLELKKCIPCEPNAKKDLKQYMFKVWGLGIRV